MAESTRRHIVRATVTMALLAGVTTARAFAQASAGAGDTPHPVPVQRAAANNALAALEITGFLASLSAFDRVVYADQTQDGKKVYSSTFSTTWDHLRTQHWVHDQDPFNVNQFAHPYQGATMYGFARSSGHRFWTSLLYANGGSFLWKMAGETDPPSIDDMITTGQAGSLLGESLYRMADLVIKDRRGDKPDRLRDYLAAAIAPPSALNRHILGDRFKTQLSDSGPATSWQIRLGATLDAVARDYSAPANLLRRDATVEFSMAYGLPGRAGYEYTRPLDYFDFQFSILSRAANPIENVMIRGLLVGRKIDESANMRGIWGLYGTYDYISPYLFRVSSTALSLGTTRQYWLRPTLAMQGSVLGGVGYGAAGTTTVIPSTPTNAAIRDYHFGVTPQALGTVRFIVSDRAMLDVAARGYFVSGVGSDDTHGSETIFRGSLGATVRVVGGHAFGARVVASTRKAQYGALSDKRLSEGTVTLSYTYLGHHRYSAVKWQ
jgi:hypothetical protein